MQQFPRILLETNRKITKVRHFFLICFKQSLAPKTAPVLWCATWWTRFMKKWEILLCIVFGNSIFFLIYENRFDKISCWENVFFGLAFPVDFSFRWLFLLFEVTNPKKEQLLKGMIIILSYGKSLTLWENQFESWKLKFDSREGRLEKKNYLWNFIYIKGKF